MNTNGLDAAGVFDRLRHFRALESSKAGGHMARVGLVS